MVGHECEEVRGVKDEGRRHGGSLEQARPWTINELLGSVDHMVRTLQIRARNPRPCCPFGSAISPKVQVHWLRGAEQLCVYLGLQISFEFSGIDHIILWSGASSYLVSSSWLGFPASLS